MTGDLDGCLPEALRAVGPTVSPVAAGLSGAQVYRVDAAGRAYVLKVASPGDAPEGWRRRIALLTAAADAGLAPRVVHVDEARRAVLSEFVAGLPFVTQLAVPATRNAAIAELGDTLRRVHALPLPPGAPVTEPRAALASAWGDLDGFSLPSWVGKVVRGVLEEPSPRPDRAVVLSHNDVNPSNLLHDGRRLVLLDWDAAGANDPLYDLATVAVFLRLDAAACAQLIAAHDQAPPSAQLPARFTFLRRQVAALCGCLFLRVARAGGHPGADDAAAPTLGEVHERMRARALDVRSPEGQWQFGFALLKASAQP